MSGGAGGYVYTFSVSARRGGKPFSVSISTSSGHSLVVDESEEYGGLNKGPNPVELFLASIAGCFIISLWIHSLRSGVAVEQVEAYIESSFDIRSFVNPEEFKPLLFNTQLKIHIHSQELCPSIESLVDRVFKS